MSDTKKPKPKPRRLRLADFIAESLHEIASHSSDAEGLHKAAASNDQRMVTILEVEKAAGLNVEKV